MTAFEPGASQSGELGKAREPPPKDRFRSARLSARCGFRKKAIAEIRGNGRDASFPVVRIYEEDFVGFSHVFRPGPANRRRH